MARNGPVKRFGPGVAAGMGAAWLGGPLLGLGVGLIAHMKNKGVLDRAAEDEQSAQGLDQSVNEQLASAARFATTDLDREQLASIADEQARLRQLSTHSDPQVRAAAADATMKLGDDINSWLTNVKNTRTQADEKTLDVQRSNIMDAAKDLRGRVKGIAAESDSLKSAASRMHSLLNDPRFDPNKPQNRGELMGLLHANARAFMADPQGLDEALGKVGGGGFLGVIPQILSGLMGEEEFNFSKEDWRRLATATYDYEGKRTQEQTARIAGEAKIINTAGRGLGVLPEGYSLGDYITGQSAELPERSPLNARPDSYPEVATATDAAKDAPAKVAGFLDKVADNEGSQKRALEDGPPVHAEKDVTRPPAFAKDFNDALSRLPVGAEIKLDPKLGRVYATVEGETREVETSGRVRRYLLSQLREGRQARENRNTVSGVIQR